MLASTNPARSKITHLRALAAEMGLIVTLEGRIYVIATDQHDEITRITSYQQAEQWLLGCRWAFRRSGRLLFVERNKVRDDAMYGGREQQPDTLKEVD